MRDNKSIIPWSKQPACLPRLPLKAACSCCCAYVPCGNHPPAMRQRLTLLSCQMRQRSPDALRYTHLQPNRCQAARQGCAAIEMIIRWRQQQRMLQAAIGRPLHLQHETPPHRPFRATNRTATLPFDSPSLPIDSLAPQSTPVMYAAAIGVHGHSTAAPHRCHVPTTLAAGSVPAPLLLQPQMLSSCHATLRSACSID